MRHITSEFRIQDSQASQGLDLHATRIAGFGTLEALHWVQGLRYEVLQVLPYSPRTVTLNSPNPIHPQPLRSDAQQQNTQQIMHDHDNPNPLGLRV